MWFQIAFQIQLVPSTAVAGWLWYGGQLVERGRLTVGELTTVVPLALEVASALVGGGASCIRLTRVLKGVRFQMIDR